MFNRISMDSGGEKIQRVQETLAFLAQKYASVIDIDNIPQEAESIENYLREVAMRVAQEFPITSHSYSLSDQLLSGLDSGKTDCRLTATVMGLKMITSGTFDEVKLMYPPSEDIHIGVLGRRGRNFYLVDFVDYGEKYRVRKSSEKQLEGKLTFSISGKGILALDKAMGK